jgi:hypothetical protein
MGIVNKRNALLGWVTWKAAKIVAKEKARTAKPGVEGGRPNKPAIAAGAATAAGSMIVWRRVRKRRSGGAEPEVDVEPAGGEDAE